jgi:hypothetical protein
MAGERVPLGIWVGEPRLPSPTIRVSKTYRDTIHERDLTLYQAAAVALTNAGLGTYRVALVELEPDPFTGRTVSDFTSYIPIAVTLRNGEPLKLIDLAKRASGARERTEQEGKSPEEIDQAVQVAIGIGIASYLEQLPRSNEERDQRPPRESMPPQDNNNSEPQRFGRQRHSRLTYEERQRRIPASPDARRLWESDHARRGTVPPGYTDIDDASEADINAALDAIAKIKGRWLFRYLTSASIRAHFPPIPHESASHSRDYEHATSIVGKQKRVRWRRVTPAPPAAPWPPGGQRCQSLR